MATPSLSSIKQRKKILTYGKKPSPAVRPGSYDFFEADELSSDTPIKRRRISPPEPVEILSKTAETVQTHASGSSALNDLSRRDTFDVPSDDDDVVEISLPSFSSKRLKAPSKLFDDRPMQQQAPSLDKPTDNATAPSPVASERSAPHAMPTSAASSTLSALERLKLRKKSVRKHATLGAGETSADSSASSSPAPYSTSNHNGSEPRSVTDSSIPRNGLNPGKLRRANKQSRASSTRGPSPQTTPEPEQPAHQVATPRSAQQNDNSAMTLTPKQSKLWDGLLDFVSDHEHDADRVKVRDSRVKAAQRDVRPVKHVRLADKLGISTISSDLSVGNVSSARDTGVDIMDIDPPSSQSASRELAATRSTHDSQASRKINGSNRRTYSQQRSYLEADERHDELHHDITANSIDSAPARSISKRNENFDFDVSDSEDKSGKVQSIHELRAAGRLSREAAAIESLLADAQNHAASARRQRKLAIVRLGTMLLVAEQAKQFVHDGHDRIIATEITKNPDKTTSALLMSIMLLLLRAGLSPTTLEQLRLSIPRMLALLDEVKDFRETLVDEAAPLIKPYDKEVGSYLDQLSDMESLWLEDTPEVLNMRVISKQLMHELFHKLRQQGDRSELLSSAGLKSTATGLASMSGTDCMFIDQMLSVSILESASLGISTVWPTEVVENVAALLRNQSTNLGFYPQLRFLSYRLAINMTNGTDVDHAIFAKQGAVSVLLHVISVVFEKQSEPEAETEQQDVKEMDLLVLAIGIMSNLTEYSSIVRQSTLDDETKPLLLRTIKAFRSRHETAREVDSEGGTTSNVAYGYLAVMLANLVQEPEVKSFVSEQLAGNNLKSLVEAIEEFLAHHRQLDSMHFDGAEGKELWSSETARLEDVLQKLQAETGLSQQ